MPALQGRFPGSSQVVLLGLERVSDADLCTYAARYDFVLCLGNASNDAVLAVLLGAADRLAQAFADPATGVVVLG